MARDNSTECETPFVYMPEHRWRVEEPSEGAVAGNVRAVFEDMSKTVLVSDYVAPTCRKELHACLDGISVLLCCAVDVVCLGGLPYAVMFGLPCFAALCWWRE